MASARKAVDPDSRTAMSYYDANLKRGDVRLLTGNFWINDAIIHFYFEYMEREMFRNNGRSMMFMAPSIAQHIKLSPDYLTTAPASLQEKRFVFTAVNDEDQDQAYGGTHWVLLAFSRPDEKLYCFDSLCTFSGVKFLMNAFICRLKTVLNCPYAEFIQKPCRKQENDYDCGIHVLYNAEVLARRAHEFDCLDDTRLQGFVNTDHSLNIVPLDLIINKRAEILALIRRMGGRSLP